MKKPKRKPVVAFAVVGRRRLAEGLLSDFYQAKTLAARWNVVFPETGPFKIVKLVEVRR